MKPRKKKKQKIVNRIRALVNESAAMRRAGDLEEFDRHVRRAARKKRRVNPDFLYSYDELSRLAERQKERGGVGPTYSAELHRLRTADASHIKGARRRLLRDVGVFDKGKSGFSLDPKWKGFQRAQPKKAPARKKSPSAALSPRRPAAKKIKRAPDTVRTRGLSWDAAKREAQKKHKPGSAAYWAAAYEIYAAAGFGRGKGRKK